MTAKKNETQPETVVATPEEMFNELTAFQRDLLIELARLASSNKQSYGLAIQERMEARYDADINHGRLYPNLDELTHMGIINKGKIDKRTNEYVLTETGRQVIRSRFRELEKVLSN